MVHSAAILPFEDSGDAPALLAELAADGFERVPVFANAPDFELFYPHRALLGQRCDVPQGHGSIACNVLVATPVYLDHQENLGWDLVNYQLWQRRTSVRKAGTWLQCGPRESHTKINVRSELVGMAGFEPAASCSQSRRANQAAPHPARPIRSLPSRALSAAPRSASWPPAAPLPGPSWGRSSGGSA